MKVKNYSRISKYHDQFTRLIEDGGRRRGRLTGCDVLSVLLRGREGSGDVDD